MAALAHFGALSSAQLAVLQTHMQQLDGQLRQTGTRVIFNILSEEPGMKRLWPQFRPIHDSALLGSKELAEFAERFMGGLQQVVCALNDGDDQVLQDKLTAIAGSHKKNGVNSSHIQHMSTSFCDMLRSELGPEFDSDARQAWLSFFQCFNIALNKLH